MTLLRSGNETSKDCTNSCMVTEVLPVSDTGDIEMDVTKPGDMYLNLLLKTYQDQKATLKHELKEKNNIILKLLNSAQKDLKACETLENPTTSKNASSSDDSSSSKAPWQQTKPKNTVRRVDQTDDNVTISTANRFKNLSESEWIREDVYENSDDSGGSNKASARKPTQVNKATRRKDVEVEKNPERNSHSPYRRNGLQRDSDDRRTVAIIGDSMIKDLKFKDFQSRCPKEKIYVKSYPGSTIRDMTHYIQPTAERNPDAIFLHTGTNSLKDSESSEQTANEILELAASIKTDQNEVVVSSIITRGDDLNDKAQEVNEILYSHCNDFGITYLDNSNIEKYNLTYRGRFPGLHLNKSGSDILLSNFVDFINM